MPRLTNYNLYSTSVKIKAAAVAFLALFLIHCTPPSVGHTVVHEYRLLFEDQNGRPIEGGLIHYSIKNHFEVVDTAIATTGPQGQFFLKVIATNGPYYSTELRYKIEKQGFCSHEGTLFNDYGHKHARSKNAIIEEKITMAGPVLHEYRITINDIRAEPLDNVIVNYQIFDKKLLVKDTLVTLETASVFSDSLFVYPEPALFLYTYKKSEYSAYYNSTLKVTIEKEGYYSISKEVSFSAKKDSLKEDVVVLIKPSDYLNPGFLQSDQDSTVKEAVLAFIDIIRFTALIANSYLETHSIDFIEFKDNMYLRFKFNNTTIYNSLKMNKYDIGKRLFDEVVREVLDPLNVLISQTKLFYGYDIEVVGYTKDFSNDSAVPIPIEYAFLIPDETVRFYKAKDISGQQLLNQSVVLMNDERIELRLQ